MTRYRKLISYLSGSAATALLSAASLVPSSPAAAACNGPAGTGSDTSTVCVTAVAIPGQPLRSFDISWVNTTRSEYYLADRSNAGIIVVSTRSPFAFLRTIPGFVGIKPTSSGGVNSATSGPNGVTAHGNWLYAGDGDSTLHTINLTAQPLNKPPQTVVGTGGTTRLDEMALTADGNTLIAANNAENPPFATVFTACGDSSATTCTPTSKGKVTISSALLPPNFGLGLEQPIWDPNTNRFYVSVPTIANNPAGCNYGQLTSGVTCSGGMAVIDPTAPFPQTLGPFDPVAFSGVVPLRACNPTGIAGIAPNGMIMESCSVAPVTVINERPPFNFAEVFNIGGADEIWYNSGDKRYYLGASKNVGTPGSNCVSLNSTTGAPISPPTSTQCPALGVVDIASVLLETIPVSSGTHSVAADSNQNYIFVPQVGTIPVVGIGGDTTTNGAAICGSNNGCVAVYQSPVPPPTQIAQTQTQTLGKTQTQTQTVTGTGKTQSLSQSQTFR
jgi:hypothetical protein